MRISLPCPVQGSPYGGLLQLQLVTQLGMHPQPSALGQLTQNPSPAVGNVELSSPSEKHGDPGCGEWSEPESDCDGLNPGLCRFLVM